MRTVILLQGKQGEEIKHVNTRMNEIEFEIESMVQSLVDLEEEAVNSVAEACENLCSSLLDHYDSSKFVRKKKGIPLSFIPGIA